MQPQAFDEYAVTYDSHFTNSPIGKLQRAQVWKLLTTAFKKNKRILEINCGTGADAIELAVKGHRVTATDVSAGMIEASEQKAQAAKVNFKQCAFNELGDNFEAGQFDFVLSNFGGLNCADEQTLKQLSADIAKLLSANGQMLLVIMGTQCKWEQFYFILKGNFKEAFRRKRSDTTAVINGIEIRLHYYSPIGIENIFARQFVTERINPVGLFIPPSYLNPFFQNKPRLLNMLGFIDKLFGRFAFTANHADHFAILLRKK